MESTADSYSPKRGSISSLHNLHLAGYPASSPSKLSPALQADSTQATLNSNTDNNSLSNNTNSSPPPSLLQPMTRNQCGGSNNSNLSVESASLSESGTATAAAPNASNPFRDLDKFTRYFIKKTFQIIVQSRLNKSTPARTECKANGNDWFNLNVVDVPEVSSRIRKSIDNVSHYGFTIRTNWRICCEISLRTNDGKSIQLENWILSNNVLQNSASSFSNATFAATTNPNRISQTNFTHLSSVNTSAATSAIIYSIYNRMSLMLKTLLSTTHIVPAYQIANRGLLVDSQVMCYRIYSDTPPYQTNQQLKHSPGTSHVNNFNVNNICNSSSISREATSTSEQQSKTMKEYEPPSPIVRSKKTDLLTNSSSNTSSSGSSSINVRDFISAQDLEHFGPVLKLGSIKSDISELNLTLCYRMDMRGSGSRVLQTTRYSINNRYNDDDCLTAAKQLLEGSNFVKNDLSAAAIAERKYNGNERFICEVAGDGHMAAKATNNNKENGGDGNLTNNTNDGNLNKPLQPAFATNTKSSEKDPQDPNLVVIEAAFEDLLKLGSKPMPNDYLFGTETSDSAATNSKAQKGADKSKCQSSEPILVPQNRLNDTHFDRCANFGPSSTPKSLTDSFVFVDLNVPFASDGRGNLGSFFHGPSPMFNNNNCDMLKNVDELTSHLADIEADANQLDEFVDSICASENDESIESLPGEVDTRF